MSESPPKNSQMAEPKPEPSNHSSEKHVKVPNLFERAKDEKSPQHQKETHGRSDDIDEDTPVEEVKGPSVFERVKEEVEAMVQAILPKK